MGMFVMTAHEARARSGRLTGSATLLWLLHVWRPSVALKGMVECNFGARRHCCHVLLTDEEDDHLLVGASASNSMVV